MLASFSEYLPLDDLLKILVVCLVVAVVAPSSVALAIAGIDRRTRAQSEHRSSAVGYAFLAVGVGVLVALIVAGIYLLINR
jgi:hypothetical protein